MLKFSEKTHEQLIAKWRENPEYVKAYDALEKAFDKVQSVRKQDNATVDRQEPTDRTRSIKNQKR